MSFSSCGKLKLDPKAIGSKGAFLPLSILILKRAAQIFHRAALFVISTGKAEIRNPLDWLLMNTVLFYRAQ